MMKNKLKKGQRLTEIAAGLEGFLALSKVVIGLLSGSVVLISDALHSIFDLLTIFASWSGLKIAQKKPDEKFPYGYYKAENIATVFISLLIFYAFSQMVVEGFSRLTELTTIEFPFLALGISAVDAVFLFFFGRYEMKVGREINSESLVSLGKENQTHIFSSSAVFLGTLATINRIPYVEGLVTILVSGLILKIGVETFKQGILGLMDVSPGKEVENKILKIIESVPGVEEAFELKLRKSGRQITSFLVHIEPHVDEYQHLVFPVENEQGLKSTLSDKFSRASYFTFVNLKKDEIIGIYTVKNPYLSEEVRVGLKVSKLINQQRADTLITKEIGEIAFHTLSDYFIDLFKTADKSVDEAVKSFLSEDLKKISEPTKTIG